MNIPLRILHVDDNLFDRQLVQDALEHDNDAFVVTPAASRAEYEAQLASGRYDLVLTDFNILGFEGLQVIDDVREKHPNVPVIVVTGTGSEEVAVEAMKRGAIDYVIKTPRHIRRLPLAIRAAMELVRLRNERARSEAALRTSEAQLRAFASALPDLAFIVDADGRYLRLLSTPEHLLYMTAESQQGKLVTEVLPDAVANQVMAALQKAVNTGVTQSVEYQLDMPTGPANFEARISLMASALGEKPQMVYVVRDITDRKAAERDLKTAQQILEQQNSVLTALYEIERALSTTLDSGEIYQIIHQQFVQRLFDAPDLTVALYDEATQRISPRWAVVDDKVIDLERTSFVLPGEQYARDAIRTRKPQIADLRDAGMHPLPSIGEASDENQRVPATALYVPLISGDQVIGVLHVQSCDLAIPHDVDLGLVETVAAQCAVALANAHLYEQAQQEIRERRLVESKLERERNLLRTLIDNIPDYIFATDHEGRFIVSNVGHAAVAQLTPRQLIGKAPAEIFSPELHQWIHVDDDAVIITGQPLINQERHMADVHGRPQWVLTTKVPLHSEQGEVIGLVGIARNISQRKRAEEALRASEEHLRAVVSGAPVILFALDTKGIITLLQGQGLDRIGFRSEVYLGKAITEFQNEPFLVIEEYIRLALTGEESSAILTLRDAIFDVHCSPLYDKAGKVVQVIGVAVDITERFKAERLQIEMEKEQEIIALKERFLATASHDFRTPLTIIKMSANLLVSRFDRMSAEMRMAKLQQIGEQVDRMTQLLDDVLTMSKANAGKLDFEPEPVMLRSFCTQIWDSFHRIAEHTHTIDFIYRANVDQVVIDPNLIHHILVNLLSNAIKYTPEHGRVCFEVGNAGDELFFRVSDNGIGIPKQDQAMLFQPFHRATNTKWIDGTGLGLSIVKTYVEVHGGRISFESAEGKGTSFLVHIPQYYKLSPVSEITERSD